SARSGRARLSRPQACPGSCGAGGERMVSNRRAIRGGPAMKAALYDTHGPAAEVLRVEEVELPERGPGEVRVRVAVSAINPTDYKSRSGATPRPMDAFQIPHHDGAGVIDAIGDGVDPARVGQRVWTWMAAAGRRW